TGADFPALQNGVALELISAPEVRLIARHPGEPLTRRGQAAAEGRIRVQRAFRGANIVIGVVGDHVPTGKDFALNIELRPRAAPLPDYDGTASESAEAAVVGRIRIGNGDIRLDQFVITAGDPQLSIEEFELGARLPALGARGRGELAWKDEALIGAIALGVIAVEAHPLLR